MWRAVLMLATVVVYGSEAVVGMMPCEEANMKCAYRTGCGRAMQNYLVGCSSVLQGPPATHCPENCQHALIALTSTDEGKHLMICECSDDFCEKQKQRVEICRPQVQNATRKESVVSCTIAQWICAADPLCITALDYYNRYCRSMFQGKKCTARCKNSIDILRRQEKAAKLQTCKCDGQEDYDCPKIQANMARLCSHKKNVEPPPPVVVVGETETNVITERGPNSEGSAPDAGARAGAQLPLLVLVATAALLGVT